jgi:HlyD family secretion protein
VRQLKNGGYKAMKKHKMALGLLLAILLSGCGMFKNGQLYNGRLEADKIRLSSQVTGIVNQIAVEEGDAVDIGQVIAIVNKDKLYLEKEQIQAELNLKRSLLKKTINMLMSGASTGQQKDELTTRVSILEAQLHGINLRLDDATIKSPIRGVIINKFVREGELVGPGTLIVEVANLNKLEAIIYLPLEDLPSIKIGQKVTIFADGMPKRGLSATIAWISDESEFTPKTILTKETRTSLVYAVKILVENPDGKLKIGMPIDVKIVPQD